jgi:hypothetical protein
MRAPVREQASGDVGKYHRENDFALTAPIGTCDAQRIATHDDPVPTAPVTGGQDRTRNTQRQENGVWLATHTR